ncbi:MAG: rod shape-determining protein MreC [Blastocatellia bacterium]
MKLTDKAKDKAKKNPRLLLVVLVIAHLILISLNRVPGQPNLRYLHVVMMMSATPLQWVGSQGASAFKSVWYGYFALRGAKLENDWLKTRNAELETQVIELREKGKLFDQINALNQSALVSAYPHVNASVIGRDADQWFNTVVIDRGSLSGVIKDQPVMTAEGLIGRVIVVSPISSRVLLITDERHGAGAVIGQMAENRWLGVLKGKNQSLCELRFLAAPGKLENGEQVITSGQDQLYPKGLLIGRVRNLNNSGVIPQAVEVEPAAPLEKLEAVAVLMVSPEEVRRQYDELIREEKEKEKEKQDKTPDRRRR